MKLLYARGTTDEDIRQQLEAMSAMGIVGDRTIVDRGSEESLPGLLASGRSMQDTLVIESPERLAPTAAGALKMAILLLRHGCIVEVLHPRLTMVANAIDALTFAGELEKKVRQARIAGGAKGGRPDKMSPEVEQRTEQAWTGSERSSKDIAADAGVSVRTLQRMFGPRPDSRTRSDRS